MQSLKTGMHKVPQRINVVGSSGSGKSTFSRQLAAILEIPHVEMDAVFWGAEWDWPSDEKFFAKLEKELEPEHWVLDGNYTRTIPIKWRKVQTVIWLDYSFLRTFIQSLKRAVVRAWTQEELWSGTGNRESFKKSFFSKDSIILWSVSNYGKVRKKYDSMIKDEKWSHIDFIRLESPEESTQYLQSIEKYIKTVQTTSARARI